MPAGFHSHDVADIRKVEKERQKLEKQKKFDAKKAKQQASGTTGAAAQPKAKEKKKPEKTEAVSEKYIERTPKGEKKSMWRDSLVLRRLADRRYIVLEPLDDAFHKAYIPAVVESAWNDWWEKQGYFQPEFTKDGKVKEKGSFVIAIPPPNVTGALHCGHALAISLQDVLIRW